MKLTPTNLLRNAVVKEYLNCPLYADTHYYASKYSSLAETYNVYAHQYPEVIKPFKPYKHKNGYIEYRDFNEFCKSLDTDTSRIFLVKKKNTNKTPFIFFEHDILYLLYKDSKLCTLNNIFGFISPSITTFTFKNDSTDTFLYSIILDCRTILRRNYMYRYILEHHYNPVFITKDIRKLFIMFSDKEDFDTLLHDLKSNNNYDKEYFRNIINYNEEHIYFIMKNYAKIHSQPK